MGASMMLNSYEGKLNEEFKRIGLNEPGTIVVKKKDAGNIVYIARVIFDCFRAKKEAKVSDEIGEIYHPIDKYGQPGGWDYKNKDEIKRETMKRLEEDGMTCTSNKIVTKSFEVIVEKKHVRVTRF